MDLRPLQGGIHDADTGVSHEDSKGLGLRPWIGVG